MPTDRVTVELLTSDVARREALRRVLSPLPGRLASHADVQGLLNYVQVCGIAWDAFRPADGGDGALAMLRLPGRVGVLLLSPVTHRAAAPGPVELVTGALQRAASLNLNYMQTLIEPEDAGRRAAFERAGFRHLTQLIYLERGATYPWVDPPADPANWTPFARATEQRFQHTLLKTYEGTLDCPELAGRRTPGEILAAHRASGAFEPALWELVELDAVDAGCMLLHRVPGHDSLEVAYMGVVPEFRGRGVGAMLLRRALVKTRACGCARLKVVVDERNAPARTLYERFDFGAIARREAYLRFVGGA